MSEKILLTHRPSEVAETLHETLRAAGFFLLQSQDFVMAARQLAERPALWLIEAELLLETPGARLVDFPRLCREQETSPLACALSDELSLAQMQRHAPWLQEILPRPTLGGELLIRLESLLRVRRLRYERNLAQKLLLAKQLEIDANRCSAATIQKTLLPSAFPHVNQFAFDASFQPCDKVGGDLYAVTQLDENQVMAYLFDVSGHGIPAAMVTVAVNQSLSPHTGMIVKQPISAPPYYRLPSPAEVLSALDEEYPLERFEKFFTIAYLLIDQHKGTVRYSCAGHPPPLLVRRNGSVERLSAGGTLIGLGGVVPYGEAQVQLTPGERIFLYSDGVTEYRNAHGELFGEERLCHRLKELRRWPLAGACNKVLEALYDFSRGGGPHDDVTLLAIEYTGRTTP
ncbi:MAG: hypothetical protein C0621_01220 [Desulfuromonas sp.]|nr:MAG: hypothetical protein C0621_01220 [Desulfuromonas sp.]